MKNVMVDLETLGSTPGCVVLSIGAVTFDPSGHTPLDEGFYVVLNTEDCMEKYLHQEPETVAWWERQSDEARTVLREAVDPKVSVPLRLGLEKFNEYVVHGASRREVAVWGNGSDFDNAILAVAYKMAELKPGWEFWNNRCYRTLKNLIPGPKLERQGTYHNALDDARSQALHAIDLLKAMPGLKW